MAHRQSRFVFGQFEFEPRSGELRRQGRLRRLSPKPSAALTLLLESAGEVVSRELLCRTLWPDETVEFDDSLNHVLKRLRDALGDAADNPVFVQTLPGAGYRFIAPVERIEPGPSAGRGRRGYAIAALAFLVLLLLVGFNDHADQKGLPSRQQAVTRSEITLPADLRVNVGFTGFLGLGISPDGSRIVYSGRHDGRSKLYLRRLDDFEPVGLEGTDGASSPTFSPDGLWIAFLAGGQLRKIPIMGGIPVTIASIESLSSARAWGVTVSWGERGLFVSGRLDTPLFEVESEGLRPVTVLRTGERGHSFSSHLPDGKGVLFTAIGAGSIGVLRPDGSETRVRIEAGLRSARYVESGHIVYLVRNRVHAVPFDVEALRVTGSPKPVLTDTVFRAPVGGEFFFATSRNGTLVYAPDALRRTLVWAEPGRTPVPADDGAVGFRYPALSPDGDRVAVEIQPQQEVWVVELATGLRRLLCRSCLSAAWLPDGSGLIYWAQGAFRFQDTEHLQPEQKVLKSQPRAFPHSVTPDGRLVAYNRSHPSTGWDVWLLDLGSQPPSIRPLLTDDSNTLRPRFSPDGRWLVHVSDRSGQEEIYVQPFPAMSKPIRVSTSGGRDPDWSPDGSRIYYLNGGQLLAASFQPGARPRLGRPEVVLNGNYHEVDVSNYAVHPDGDRFLMILPDPDKSPRRFLVVQNWFEEIKRFFR